MLKTNKFNCPNCGAPVDLRFPEKTLSVACTSCGSILDTSEEAATIIQAFKKQKKVKPRIPVGSRGTFEGQPFEIIGFMKRKDNHGGKWEEYLLFNPYLGYRYLSQWQGHWSYITIVPNFPIGESGEPQPPEQNTGDYSLGNKKYKPFFDYSAQPTYVAGEFNYKVSLSERAEVSDYISPPEMLSAERYHGKNEIVWSHGLYKTPKEIADAFDLPDLNKKPVGVAPNQPNPYKGKSKWALLLALLLTIGTCSIGEVLEKDYEKKQLKTFTYEKNMSEIPWKRGGGSHYREVSVDYGEIEIPKKPRNLLFQLDTNVSNSWVYAVYFVLNEETNKGYTFTQEISYYYGYTDGESWSEGSRSGSITTRALPPGKYYVFATIQTNHRTVLKLKGRLGRDVPNVSWSWFIYFWFWMLPMYIKVKSSGFEKKREE